MSDSDVRYIVPHGAALTFNWRNRKTLLITEEGLEIVSNVTAEITDVKAHFSAHFLFFFIW